MMEHIAPWRDLGMEHPQTKVLVHRNHGGFRAIFHTDRWKFFWSSIFLFFWSSLSIDMRKTLKAYPAWTKWTFLSAVAGASLYQLCPCMSVAFWVKSLRLPLGKISCHATGMTPWCFFLDGIKHQAIQAIQQNGSIALHERMPRLKIIEPGHGAWLNTKHE
jgi:hypothetical protein